MAKKTGIKTFLSKRWKIIAIVLAVGLLLFFANQRIKANKIQKSITTATASQRDIKESVSASGKIKADEEVSLRFQASGYLAWVGVKEGDWVEPWQALASLDKEQLTKQLKQELYDYENERYDLDEERKDNNVTSNNFAGFTMTDAVKYDLLRSQNTLDRTVIDVEIANIALKYATLITPIGGIITKIDVPYAGVNITPAGAEITVSNPNKLIFSANIDEVDIGRLVNGQTAAITLDAYPDDTIEASVQKIDFNSTLTSGGGTAYAVEFNLPEENTALKYKLGMNGDIEVIISEKKGVLTVPIEAVKDKDGQKYVWVPEGNTYVTRDVTTGLENEDDLEIVSGLNEGDRVVIAGFANLGK